MSRRQPGTHLPGEPGESVPVGVLNRPARPREQTRSSVRPRADSFRSTSRTVRTSATSSTCSASCRVSGCSMSATRAAGVQPHDRSGPQPDPRPVPCRRAAFGTRRRLISWRERRESVPGLLPTGFNGVNRAGSCCNRTRSSPASPSNATARDEPIQVGSNKDGASLYQGILILWDLHWSRFTERVSKLNPTDTSNQKKPAPHATTCTPSRSTASIYELPFGSGKQLAQRWPDRCDYRRMERNAIGQLQSGLPQWISRSQHLFQRRSDAVKAHYTNNVDLPVFDPGGFYFHDAAVQTNGVDDLIKQRDDLRICLGSNIRYFPSRIEGMRSPVLKMWDISIVKQVPSQRPRSGAVQRRDPQRVQPAWFTITPTPIRRALTSGR